MLIYIFSSTEKSTDCLLLLRSHTYFAADMRLKYAPCEENLNLAASIFLNPILGAYQHMPGLPKPPLQLLAMALRTYSVASWPTQEAELLRLRHLLRQTNSHPSTRFNNPGPVPKGPLNHSKVRLEDISPPRRSMVCSNPNHRRSATKRQTSQRKKHF